MLKNISKLLYMVNSKKPSKKTSKKPSKSTSKPKALKIFCGITQPIPRGHKLGSMKECLDAKQVRYYGLKKIDNKLVESVNKTKDTSYELTIKITGLRGKLSKLKRDIDACKKTEEKKKLIQEFENTRKELLALNEKKHKQQK